jgi:Ig-like domain from next to BRCA1 gene
MARLKLNFSPAHLCFGSLLLAGALLTGACSEGNVNSSDAATRQPAEGGRVVAARAAAFVDQTVPTDLVTDQSYTVSLRMRNTGTTKWTAAEDYRVGSVNPLDNEVWGFRRVAVPVDVAPGEEVTFTFAMKAPRTPGQYNFQWRMVQDGVEWFGEETPNLLINVGGQVSREAR